MPEEPAVRAELEVPGVQAVPAVRAVRVGPAAPVELVAGSATGRASGRWRQAKQVEHVPEPVVPSWPTAMTIRLSLQPRAEPGIAGDAAPAHQPAGAPLTENPDSCSSI